jgi:hypothetical protein
VQDQTVGPGVVLTVTNTVIDPDVPTQHLGFTLLAEPTNASLTILNSNLQNANLKNWG